MNCFEWQNRSSDYLDGALIGAAKKEADEHLSTCRPCEERLSHYRRILSCISDQPRSTLPVPIRKAPLAYALPRPEGSFHRSRWERAPWFLRTGIEGLGISLVVLAVVAFVPRLRGYYERTLERRVDATVSMDFADASRLGAEASLPLARGRLASRTSAPGEESGDDFAGEREDDDSGRDAKNLALDPSQEDDALSDVRVGRGEIWRFTLRTDSPRDIRSLVVSALTALGLPSTTPGIGGTEAPGGIQFDLLVPQGMVSSLKSHLARMTPSAATAQISGEGKIENFTWYKNKSRRPIPPGKARVVIWLSHQM